MQGDLSRHTFDRRKHYDSVRMQQGRVQLDADWNEQSDILHHHVETETRDLVGGCGGPLHGAGFHVVTALTDLTPDEQKLPANHPVLQMPPLQTNQLDFFLSAGRYYVDGILCENERLVPFTAQPDVLDPAPIVANDIHLIYLDVWRRHITALDDPQIRESALGGPDTATRAKVLWQVKALPLKLPPGSDVNCLSDIPVGSSDHGQLQAHARPQAADAGPCTIAPGAGYLGLENQLYRVEIHDPGPACDLTKAQGVTAVTGFPSKNQVVVQGGTWSARRAVELFTPTDPTRNVLHYITNVNGPTLTFAWDINPPFAAADQPQLRPAQATFKWSRDNGSVATLIESIDGTMLTVHNLGPDAVRGFDKQQWVELSDDALELAGKPGQLAKIVDLNPEKRQVTLSIAPTPLAPSKPHGVDPERHPKLRRWDGIGAVEFNPPSPATGWINLESGVQVRFSDGPYRTGDYWLIPARTASADAGSGNIEWPADPAGQPLLQDPIGIRHHYCRLALVSLQNLTTTVLSDCRMLFPPVTELTSFFYLSGDGQEATPDPLQPQPAFATLPKPLVVGVANGRWPVPNAKVRFTINSGQGRLQGSLSSADVPTKPDGTASCTWDLDSTVPSQQVQAVLFDAANQPVHLPITFNANLSTADEVSYDPANCPDLKAKNVNTVRKAIDQLCRMSELQCEVVVGPGGQYERLDEAVQDLLKRKVTDLCICLLPGEHILDRGLTVERPTDGPPLHVKIVGCGPGSRIVVRNKPVIFQLLESIILRDLEVKVEAITLGDTEDPAPWRFNQCDEVALASCRVVGLATPRQALFKVANADRLTLTNNVIEAYLADSLKRPAGFLNNTVVGPLYRPQPPLDRRDFSRQAFATARKVLGSTPDKTALDQAVAKLLLNGRVLSVTERALYTRLQEAIRATGQTVELAGGLAEALKAIRLGALKVAPCAALFIDGPDGDVTLTDNDITGAISLYGPAKMDQRTSLTQLDLKTLVKKLGDFLVEAAGLLEVRGNRLNRLLVGDAVVRRLRDRSKVSVYKAAFFSENLFEGEDDNPAFAVADDHEFLAGHLALLGNDFAPSRVERFYGAAIALAAVFQGNQAPGGGGRLLNVSLRSVNQKAMTVVIGIQNNNQPTFGQIPSSNLSLIIEDIT
jgi:hypothetical protein